MHSIAMHKQDVSEAAMKKNIEKSCWIIAVLERQTTCQIQQVIN